MMFSVIYELMHPYKSRDSTELSDGTNLCLTILGTDPSSQTFVSLPHISHKF